VLNQSSSSILALGLNHYLPQACSQSNATWLIHRYKSQWLFPIQCNMTCLQIQEPVDIFLSHDWPDRITQYGNAQELLRKKKHLAKDVSGLNTMQFVAGMQGPICSEFIQVTA
jgi:hypothetical protein